MRVRKIHYAHKVTIWRHGRGGGADPRFLPLRPLGQNAKGRPEGRPFYERVGRSVARHSMPGDSRCVGAPETGEPEPQTQSAMSAHADDSEDA